MHWGFLRPVGLYFCQIYVMRTKTISFLDKLKTEDFCCLARYFNVLVSSTLYKIKKITFITLLPKVCAKFIDIIQ